MDGHEHLDLRALPGSERAPAPGVKKAGSPLPGDAPVEATLVLRRRAELNDATLGAILSRDELAVAGGADPAERDGVVTAVLGLDDRPQARAHFRTAAAASGATSYTPLQLATIYRFPGGTDGSGQTLGIVELGGGFAQSELDTYLSLIHISEPT